MSLSWWSWWERILYHDKTPRPPAQRCSTVTVSACRLVNNAMVLTSSTPYRYRVERVVWIDKPQFGPIVVHLEGTDPDTGAPTQRWHQWRSSEMVTVFVADVEIDQHGGDYNKLLERYGMAEQPKSEDGQWHRVSKLTIPE
jgi:hypothetical protein